MEPHTFKCMMPDRDDRKITDVMISQIELHDEHLVMIENYYADWKDEDLGTTDNQLRMHSDFHLRSKITGCHKHWYCKTKVWGVEINMMGVTANLNPCFKRESQAQELVDALIKWLLK